jgi:uncharacterized protein
MKTTHMAVAGRGLMTGEGDCLGAGEAQESIPRLECLHLLARARVGRIVFTHCAVPAIEPVSYRLDSDAAVLPIASGSRLATTLGNSVVAFQVDHIDEGLHGWSITAVGVAEIVAEPDEIARLSPWLSPPRNHEATTFVRVPLTTIEGRHMRLTPAGPCDSARDGDSPAA